MSTIRRLFEHTDQHGDTLDVSRITPTPSSVVTQPGITFGTTSRHGYRQAAFLPTAEAFALLAVLAGELGYRLTTERPGGGS